MKASDLIWAESDDEAYGPVITAETVLAEREAQAGQLPRRDSLRAERDAALVKLAQLTAKRDAIAAEIADKATPEWRKIEAGRELADAEITLGKFQTNRLGAIDALLKAKAYR